LCGGYFFLGSELAHGRAAAMKPESEGLRLALLDPKLHILASVGVVVLGYMFAHCWSNCFHGYFPLYSYFCNSSDEMRVFDIPYKWVLAAALLIVLLSIYRLWSQKTK
jgi:hypothetical protein